MGPPLPFKVENIGYTIKICLYGMKTSSYWWRGGVVGFCEGVFFKAPY